MCVDWFNPSGKAALLYKTTCWCVRKLGVQSTERASAEESGVSCGALPHSSHTDTPPLGPCMQTQRRKDVQHQLEKLSEELRTQIESIVDMCEKCVEEAEEALSQNETAPKPTDNEPSSDASKELQDAASKLQANVRAYMSAQVSLCVSIEVVGV